MDSRQHQLANMEILDALLVLRTTPKEWLDNQIGFVEGMILMSAFLKVISDDQERSFREILTRYRAAAEAEGSSG